jgi:hypothetical protein
MGVSRKAFIVGTGAAAAAAGPGAAAVAARQLGRPHESRDGIEVIGTIVQDGLSLVGFGWLTHVSGLADRNLFTDPANPSERTARLRWHARVTVRARNILPDLFAASGSGQLRIFYDRNGGAEPERPETFANGRLIARYSGRFENILTVTGPDQGVTEVTAELRQQEANSFQLGGGRHQLGRRRLLQRLSATGPGRRSEPNIPRATFRVAGGIVVPD